MSKKTPEEKAARLVAKEAKRAKKAAASAASTEAAEIPTDSLPPEQPDDDVPLPSKSKKSKKRKLPPTSPEPTPTTAKKAKTAFTTPAPVSPTPPASDDDDDSAAPTTDRKPPRFTIFVGNLPYAATSPSIRAHFRALSPTSIRAPTDPSTGRSKGFAFVEFAGWERMRTALAKYHHSEFDPDCADGADGSAEGGAKKSDGGHGGGKKGGKETAERKGRARKEPLRRINVELTAGGGGSKSEVRAQRIREKNERLAGERKRRFEAAEKAREEGKGPGGEEGGKSERGGGGGGGKDREGGRKEKRARGKDRETRGRGKHKAASGAALGGKKWAVRRLHEAGGDGAADDDDGGGDGDAEDGMHPSRRIMLGR